MSRAHASLVVLLVAALPQLACQRHPTSSSTSASHAFGELTIYEVDKRLRDHQPGLYLVDNNTRELFDEMHLPGARWIDYSHVTAADLPADKEATLVFYCASEH